MKFINKNVVGNKRIKSKFLWFPLSINNITRWLEKAKWEEEYICYGFTEDTYAWIPAKWLDIDLIDNKINDRYEGYYTHNNKIDLHKDFPGDIKK